MEREWKPNVEMSPACPRCGSSNTKFCYYNNYSLTQPRYFCKGCRRYWTRGGSLRNVPVGGGSRKTRRAIPKSHCYHHPSTTTTTTTSSLYSPPISTTPSNASHIDLALVYSNFLNQPPLQHHEETPQLRGDDVVAVESPTICGLDLINVDDNMQGTEGLSQGYFSTGNEDHSILMSNYGVLPPLPGEQMVWSNTQTLQVDEPEAQDLCPFDSPDYGAFLRP
ncbi:hypothetical protein LguiA_021759 [Lonicera macranthoides]